MKEKIIFLILATAFLLSTTVTAQTQVTLQFMGWEASPLETQSVKDGLKQFMKENPHIEVEYTPVAGEYSAKLLTMMVGDAAPDVFFMESAQYRNFQKRGVLLNLTEYFNKEMQLDEFIPIAQDKMVVDGKIYGLSSCNTVAVLFYNREIFDKAGLPYPPSDPDKAWSWNEFVDIAKQLTIVKNGKTVQYGIYGFKTSWGWAEPLMVKSNGGEVFNKDYTELLLDSPQAKEALVEVKKLQDEYGVAPTSITLEQTGMNAAQMLQTGRVAMLVDGSWALQQLAQMDFPLGIGVLPVFKRPVTVGQAHLHSSWVKTKHPDEAWKLVKFLSSREYQTNLIRSGLWLPNRMDMYEKKNIHTWLNPKVYPKDFENMFKFFTKYEELWPGVFAPAEAWDIILEELDNFFLANHPIDEVMARMNKRVKPILSK